MTKFTRYTMCESDKDSDCRVCLPCGCSDCAIATDARPPREAEPVFRTDPNSGMTFIDVDRAACDRASDLSDEFFAGVAHETGKKVLREPRQRSMRMED